MEALMIGIFITKLLNEMIVFNLIKSNKLILKFIPSYTRSILET